MFYELLNKQHNQHTSLYNFNLMFYCNFAKHVIVFNSIAYTIYAFRNWLLSVFIVYVFVFIRFFLREIKLLALLWPQKVNTGKWNVIFIDYFVNLWFFIEQNKFISKPKVYFLTQHKVVKQKNCFIDLKSAKNLIRLSLSTLFIHPKLAIFSANSLILVKQRNYEKNLVKFVLLNYRFVDEKTLVICNKMYLSVVLLQPPKTQFLILNE